MRKGRKIAVALAAALFVSAIPATAFGAVIKYSPEKTSTVDSSKYKDSSLSEAVETVKNLIESGKMKAEEIEKLGPGYAAALDEYSKMLTENLGVGLQEALEEDKNDTFNGPSVTKVELNQVYHEEYKTYELSMADQYFLYSNIGNGGMTHEPVTIDIPANVTYTVEKDGLPYEYVSQQYVSEKGTYVMKLVAIEDKNVPLSEQKEYQATFRFRITDEPPVEESEEDAQNGLAGAESTVGSIFGNTEIPVIGIPETQPAEKEESESKPAEETTAPETKPENEPAVVPDHMVRTERKQDFELATGNYIVTLENGKKLTTNVPEGYIGSGSVSLRVAEDDAATTTLYRNDEPVEFVNDSAVTEYGRYRLDMDGCSYFFTLAYEVGQMEYYPAPAGMDFTEVSINGEKISLASEQYVEMNEDGTYMFVMNGDHGERFEVTLLKDTVAPEMIVTTSKSAAEIQYLSNDIASLELVKDGELVSGFNSTSVTEPGNYTLTIFDKAGNSSSASFSLKYQVNLYGILAVVLVIAAIAGVGGFVVYTKKNTKVR